MNTQRRSNQSTAYFSGSIGFCANLAFSLCVIFSANFVDAKTSTTNLIKHPQIKTTQTTMRNVGYKTLNDAKWQHRVLVVKTNNEAELNKLTGILAKHAAAIHERRLIVFALSNKDVLAFTDHSLEVSNIQANELLSRLRDKKVLLIGLDGGSKTVYDELTLKQVFAQIDGMPMRQRELRQQ
ncbi:MAG: DUF4174 domain-containing protein [Glaciecola sp.]